MNTAATFNPDDYMKNAKGNFVPKDKVKDIDKLRNDVVRDLFAKAKSLQDSMRQAKQHFFEDFEQFCEVSAAEHNTHWGGKKGNVTLNSFDGSLRIKLQVAELQIFDERLQVAKKLIDECVHEWSQGANANIQALVNHAFQVDKQGNINTARVLSLRHLDIQDAKWRDAMNAISDSLTVTDTTEYMRFYERDKHGKYQPISLDFASL